MPNESGVPRVPQASRKDKCQQRPRLTTERPAIFNTRRLTEQETRGDGTSCGALTSERLETVQGQLTLMRGDKGEVYLLEKQWVLVTLNSGVYRGELVSDGITSTLNDKIVSKVVEVRLLDHPTLKICHVTRDKVKTCQN